MSDITPADALRELGDDQAEYAAAAAKKLGLPESVAAIRARRWDSPDALALGDLASARIVGEDVTVLLDALTRVDAVRAKWRERVADLGHWTWCRQMLDDLDAVFAPPAPDDEVTP